MIFHWIERALTIPLPLWVCRLEGLPVTSTNGAEKRLGIPRSRPAPLTVRLGYWVGNNLR
jgi:hypothetical protein